MEKTRILRAARLVTPLRTVEDGAVAIQGVSIRGVGTRREIEAAFPGAEISDFGDRIISPGFVDIHTHGRAGVLVDDGVEAVVELSRHLIRSGTTSFLPTALTARGAGHCAEAMRRQKSAPLDGAEVAGIHMEGPFLSPKNLESAPGADADIRPPSVDALMRIVEHGEGHVRIMGLAVELEGAAAVIRRLADLGITPAAAHTHATCEELERAVDAGLSHVTHLYNVMSGLHHRRPGVVGASLVDDRVTAELICDGHHLHPVAVDIALRCKGAERLAIITDLTLGGLPDGEYANGRVAVVVTDGVARFKGADESSDSTIVGGTLPITRGIRTVVDLGYPLQTAICMASLTPARIARIDRSKGSLESGKDADIAVLGPDLRVHAVIVRGETIYPAEG